MTTQERNAEIVALRVTGMYTLTELGEKYGITRERVRQIINATEPDKPWLTTRRHGPKRAKQQTIAQTCPKCGRITHRTRWWAERRTYCSTSCAKNTLYANSIAEKIALLKHTILPCRERGMRWKEIAETVGIHQWKLAGTEYKRHAERAGLTQAQYQIVWPGSGNRSTARRRA